MKTKVLVTGADGMLGSNVVRELLSRNHYCVRAMIQPGRKGDTLAGLEVEMVAADITDLDEVWQAAMGCDYIIHTAASTAIWPPRNRAVYAVNLEGTMNVICAASALRVKRLVHVSSANVFEPGSLETPGNETGAFTGDCYGLDYINSKYDAHQLVKKAVRGGLNAIMVNPTFMLGPYDSGQGSGSLILAIKKGSIKAIPPGGRNFVCASDAATAIVNGLTMGRTGEAYILGHENLTYRQILSLIAKIVDGRAPRISLPSALIRALGLVSTLLAKLTNTRPLMSTQVALMACHNHFFCAQKAVSELQLPQSPIEQGIQDAWNWFRQNGMA